MRVGLQDSGLAPLAQLRGGLKVASMGGASSYWLPDHMVGIVPRAMWQRKYNTAAKVVPSVDAFLEPMTTLGWLSKKSRRMHLQLGTSVTSASRRNPAVTAQAFATLHLLTHGRAVLGIGTGVRENNEPYGVEWTRPVAQFEEAVAVIRALWESEGAPVSRDGTWWPLRNALFDVPTYKGTRPPIWIAAQGPRMLDIAGRYGDGWLPMLSFSAPSDGWAPLETPKGYGERLHAVRSAAADAGRDPAAITASGWFFVITGPTAGVVDDLLATPVARLLALGLPADAWAKFGAVHPLGPGFTGGQDLLPHLIDEETALAYAERVPDGLLAAALFAGTPKELAERFAEYTDQGLQHPVLLNGSLLCSLKKGAPSFLSMVSLLRRLRRIKAA